MGASSSISATASSRRRRASMSQSSSSWYSMARIAIVLFNLGGPDGIDAVEPFLFNLFADPAIMAVPQPLRWALAKLIARRRAAVARGIYEKLGGGSPLLANTRAQAAALEAVLGFRDPAFFAMGHWLRAGRSGSRVGACSAPPSH